MKKLQSSVRRVERRLIVFKSIMEGISLEGQRRWIARCVKEAKKDPSLSEAEKSAYIDAIANYYQNRMEVLQMFKVTIIPKNPGTPKHQEYFTKAEDARWYAKMRRESGDCWIIIEEEG